MRDSRTLPRTPATNARGGQIQSAQELLTLDTSQYLHFPWGDLDGIIRGIAPGKFWMLAGYSGVGGKTTFLTNLTLSWVNAGTSVYFVPLETPPDEVWLRLACLSLGIAVGDVLTGDSTHWPDWYDQRERIHWRLAEWNAAQAEGALPFWVHPADRADAGVIEEATMEASMLGADVLILDHVDHIAGDPARGEYGVSRDVMTSLDTARKRDPSLRLLVATQLNQDAVKGDPLAKVLPPLESHIKMGGHKREVVDGMLGLYRPLRRGTTGDQLKQVRQRSLDPMMLVEPGQMGIEVMKHRARGDLLGRQAVLAVEASGRIADLPERDRYGTGYDDLKRV